MNDVLQLDFDLSEPENQFKNILKDGTFFILFEVNTPSKDRDFAASVELASAIGKAARRVRGFKTGLAITDRTESIESWNVIDFATAVLKNTAKDRHVIYISGRNSSREDIQDMIAQSAAAGLKNVVPVSGDGYSDENGIKLKKQPCFDSVHTLRMISNMEDRYALYPGCVVNPFKYTPSDSFSQYFKLIKKLNLGTNFIVTQTGWDMMKNQELRWYLNYREHHIPTIARIQLLTPEIKDEIISGHKPGIHISRDFRLILEKESQFGYKQFASAQWRRIQLQVAGSRLLGYSGIQIAGIEHPEHLATCTAKIKSALKEFTDFQTWKQAYLDHLARSEMATYDQRFYLFKNLFTSSHPEVLNFNPEGLPLCGIYDKIRYHLCKSMFSKDNLLAPDEHRLSKKIFAGCSSCTYCRIPLTHYICPELCPKGLANGPCGNTRPNGNCELREKKCIHSRRTERAAWLNEIDTLEDNYIKHPEAAAKLKNI